MQARRMNDDPPIPGCALSAPELFDRRAAWRDVAPALVDGVRSPGWFRARFRPDPGVPESLRALIDAEGDCCGWASWTLADEEEYSVLEVTGPPERILSLAAAFGL